MSFTLAALIVVALGATVLGLVAYHLLTRVHLLEQALDGGIDVPSRRLTREEFDRRFSVAIARSNLARRFEVGLVVFIGSEAERDHEVVSALRHLVRPDHVHLVSTVAGTSSVGAIPVVDADDVGFDTSALGVSTTPFAFVLDDGRVRVARPITKSNDLAALLREFA